VRIAPGCTSSKTPLAAGDPAWLSTVQHRDAGGCAGRHRPAVQRHNSGTIGACL